MLPILKVIVKPKNTPLRVQTIEFLRQLIVHKRKKFDKDLVVVLDKAVFELLGQLSEYEDVGEFAQQVLWIERTRVKGY